MSAVVVIGKKELFSFAERYSAVRLRDYTSLADGSVLCLLFNQVFPRHVIRPAPAETHSPSQRTQLNWEALYRHLVRVAIPVALLDPVALGEGNVEAGFSALVLFYFLFHLTKRMDFSAEFAMDLPDGLTQFLQSVDCVASLLIGEAVDWTGVPDTLGEQVRQLPAFHTSREVELAQEEEAAKLARALLLGGGGRGTRAVGVSPRPLPKNTQQLSVGPATSASEGANSHIALEDVPDSSSSFHASEPSSCSSAESADCGSGREGSSDGSHVSFVDVDGAQHLVADKLREEKRALIRHAASLQHKLTLARGTQRQLEMERDALLELEAEREREMRALRDEIEDLRASAARSRAESPFHHMNRGNTGRSPLASMASSLLDDVIDTETGSPIDAHDRANMLHCLLVEHLQAKPGPRAQAQQWLWSLLSAYHVLETRLVAAVEVIEALQADQQEGTPAEDQSSTRTRTSPPVHVRSASVPPARRSAQASTPKTQPKTVHTDAPLGEHGQCNACRTVVAACDAKLTEAHEREHALQQRVAHLESTVREMAQHEDWRETRWRSLCSALHTAEQASFTIATSESENEVAQLLHDRHAAYDIIEEMTSALLNDDCPPIPTTPSARGADSSPCAAVVLQAALLRDENESLRRQWRSLASAVESSEANGSSCRCEHSVEERIAQQQRYEASSRESYRASPDTDDTEKPTATPPHLLQGRGASGSKAVSPYAKSLLKLLTEASSPVPMAC